MGALANQSSLKMNGIGNEIVVVDLRTQASKIEPDEVRAVDAPQGAPYDQLMALYPPRTPGTDAFVCIYNNDGSEAGACGNGMRCVADLMSKESGKTALTFETTAGILNCWKGADGLFTEATSYSPNSPYSASKASSDHLVRAWRHTYGLPVLVTNCSNNYGPYQFPEKLIPLMILNALHDKPLPIYGKGDNVRDWLYVDDHARALRQVFENGVPGETYNVGGHNEKTNLEVVDTLCALLDELKPRGNARRYHELKTFVADRPGHDRRYAIDATKIERELGWLPRESFETGMRKTVAWYLANEDWIEHVVSGEYRNWVKQNYSDRNVA